ncbi:hypothetical protein Ancab_029244 [Ancistrocladus abbreviatus]
MARSLSQTIAKLTPLSLSNSSPSRLLTLRHRTNLPEKSNRIDIELGSDAEMERIAIQKLEDAIHRIIIKRSQPKWLPFVPGASYWVPPKSKARGFAEVISKLAVSVNKDEAMSLATDRGWPSSEYFFKGASPSPLEGETDSKKTSRNEEEEG